MRNAAADDEYESFLAFAGLAERDLRRVGWSDGPSATSIWRMVRILWAAGRSPSATRGSRSRQCSGGSRRTCVVLLDKVIRRTSRFWGPATASGRSAATRGRWSTGGTPNRSVLSRSRSPRRRARPTAARPAHHLRRVRRPQGGDQQAAAPRRPARQSRPPARAGVPDRRPRLRHPVPPRTGRGRPVHPDRGLQTRGLLRAPAGRRAQGTGPPQQRHPPACHPAPVHPLRPPTADRGRAGPQPPGRAQAKPRGHRPPFPERFTTDACT